MTAAALPIDQVSVPGRQLAICTFADEKATTPIKRGTLSWGLVVGLHARRRIRDSKSGRMIGGYALDGARNDANVSFRSIIQLDIDTEGRKDKATGRILEVTRAAPALEDIRPGISQYEWIAASSHSHEPQSGVIKYRIVMLPDRDIQREEWEPLLEALDELLHGALDRGAWQWSQAFYLPSSPPENQGDAFFAHNQGVPLPVDEFVQRGREIIAVREAKNVHVHPKSNLALATVPPVEMMRAMLEYLVAKDYFEDRKEVQKDADGRIKKLGWVETGMALKLAYGDDVGIALWKITHADERARRDAPTQWASFAAKTRPGHITIATIIKAAHDAGFRSISSNVQPAELGYVSHGPFTMDAADGLTKEILVRRGKAADVETVWISGPFETLGHCRDPSGRAWGKQLRFRDADNRVHMRHISDAALQGDPAALCAILADEGLKISRSRQRELIEYLNGVTVDARVTVVDRTGWSDIGGQPIFVLPSETIGATIGETVILDAVAHGPYETRGSLEDWKQGVGRLTAGHALPVFMVSAALAGPLAHLVGAEGGGIHVFGPSSIGKSAVLQAAASVWGRGSTRDGYVRSWRATANGLEGAAASANDTCLVLDELGVGDARDVAAAVYALANGIGKARSARDGSLRAPKSWQVSILSSGELPIETKLGEDRGRKTRAGQLIRLLDIPADRGLGSGAFDHAGHFGDAGKLADAIKDTAGAAYGTAGPQFVRYLITATPEQIAGAKQAVADFVRRVVQPGASEQITRAAKRFALIGLAGELARSFGVAPWQKGEARVAAIWAFNRWVERWGGTGSHEERQAVEQVRLLIEQNGEARFENADGNGPAVRDRLGWRHGEGSAREWWIPSETWKAIFCEGLDPSFVARTLETKGMLRRHDRKRLQRLVTVDQRKVRVYVLTAAILESV